MGEEFCYVNLVEAFDTLAEKERNNLNTAFNNIIQRDVPAEKAERTYRILVRSFAYHKQKNNEHGEK